MAGNILISSDRYDVDALEADVIAARQVVDFGAGAYGHSLSLPAEDEIQSAHRSHRNNIPYANVLGSCPLFAEIFHSFQAQKGSYRLLRRVAGTAYSLHDDRDMGDDIVRMQLPVVTNSRSIFLIQKDGVDSEPIKRRVAEITRDDGPLVFDYPRLIEAFGDWFDLSSLEPGYFNLININKIHTLINAGQDDRVTLAVDLVRNDWLERWLADHMTGEITALSTDSLPDGTWDWSTLRHGLLIHPHNQLA